MKGGLKYFLIRISILIVFSISAIFIYEKTMYSTTLKSEGWLKKMGENSFSKRADVLYFSASPNFSYSEKDIDKRTIHEKIRFDLKKYSIEALDTGAIHAGIFLHALKHLPTNYKPKIVLMDLNLRSFGNRWIHSELENSLQRNLVYWNNYPGLYNRLKASLKSYDYIPFHERTESIHYVEKFQKLPFNDSCETVQKWIDSLSRRSDHADGIGYEMVRNFGFVLDSKNEMLNYYDQIVEVCNAKNIKLVFLILAENLEGMEEKAGENLKKMCYQNVTYLKSHFRDKQVTIINEVDKLNSTYFFDIFPTEHYISEGREIIAKDVAKVLSELKIKPNGNQRSTRNN